MVIERCLRLQSQRIHIPLSSRQRQVFRSHYDIEQQSYSCSHNSREEGIKKCFPENAPCILLTSERSERGDDGQRDGRYGQQLEQPCINRGHEIHQTVEPTQTQQPQNGTYNEGNYP